MFKTEFVPLIMKVARFYDAEKKVNDDMIEMYFESLQHLPYEIVRAAFNAHAKDPESGKYFPLPAHLFKHLIHSDGRPGSDEAWALMPKHEQDSAVVSREMLQAWDIARHLYESDEVGSRMAFRSSYDRLVNESRAKGQKVEWVPSLGFDKEARAVAIDRAVTAGRLERSHGDKLLLTPPKVEHLLLAASNAASDDGISPAMKAKIAVFMKGINERAKKYDAAKGVR